MNADWYPGIRAFCAHWQHAPMLQQTFQTLEREFGHSNDSCIDAAKGFVECACRVIIEELDDPAAPIKPEGNDVPIHALVGTAVRLLKLGDTRDRQFADLIKHHNNLTDALRKLRNEAGTLSHGKDGFIAKLTAHHHRSALLSADAIVTFLHEAYLEQEPDPVSTLEPYERFAVSNEMIDETCSIVAAEVDDEGYLSVTIRLPGETKEDQEDLAISVSSSELLFGVDRDGYKQALVAAREAKKRSVAAAVQQVMAAPAAAGEVA